MRPNVFRVAWLLGLVSAVSPYVTHILDEHHVQLTALFRRTSGDAERLYARVFCIPGAHTATHTAEPSFTCESQVNTSKMGTVSHVKEVCSEQ
jgi:hypothetical protein